MEPTSVVCSYTTGTSKQLAVGRSRLKEVFIEGALSGDALRYTRFYDGTAISADQLKLEIYFGSYYRAENGNAIVIPGNGMLFENGIFMSFDTLDIDSVTILFNGGAPGSGL